MKLLIAIFMLISSTVLYANTTTAEFSFNTCGEYNFANEIMMTGNPDDYGPYSIALFQYPATETAPLTLETIEFCVASYDDLNAIIWTGTNPDTTPGDPGTEDISIPYTPVVKEGDDFLAGVAYSSVDVSGKNIILNPGDCIVFGTSLDDEAYMGLTEEHISGSQTYGWYENKWSPDKDLYTTACLQLTGTTMLSLESATWASVKASF